MAKTFQIHKLMAGIFTLQNYSLSSSGSQRRKILDGKFVILHEVSYCPALPFNQAEFLNQHIPLNKLLTAWESVGFDGQLYQAARLECCSANGKMTPIIMTVFRLRGVNLSWNRKISVRARPPPSVRFSPDQGTPETYLP